MVLGAPKTNAKKRYQNITVLDTSRDTTLTANSISVSVVILMSKEAYSAELEIASDTAAAHLIFSVLKLENSQ